MTDHYQRNESPPSSAPIDASTTLLDSFKSISWASSADSWSPNSLLPGKSKANGLSTHPSWPGSAERGCQQGVFVHGEGCVVDFGSQDSVLRCLDWIGGRKELSQLRRVELSMVVLERAGELRPHLRRLLASYCRRYQEMISAHVFN